MIKLSIKMKYFSLGIVFLLLIMVFSCSKPSPATSPPNLSATLMGYTWQLTSYTNYDGSNKVIGRYQGLPGDSVIFVYGSDRYGNVVPQNINSYIGGQATQYSFSEAYLYGSTSIQYLLLVNPSWKTGYSDTLYITNFSQPPVVFKVNNPAGGNGYEIDSLKIGRSRPY